MKEVRKMVERLRREKYEKVISNYPNVELLEGTAEFLSPEEVLIKYDGKEFNVKANNYLIATGSKPSIPPIDGLDKVEYLTSDTIWNLEKLPESTIIIGGGAIGLELGQALQHFGSQVSIIEALPRICYIAEPEISNVLQEILEEEGMKFYLRSRVSRVRKEGEKIVVEVLTKKGLDRVEGEALIIATGRKANTENLGLDKAKVDLDDKGFIKVDDYMRTSNPSIYAAGDVISKSLMLETLAAREGVIAALNIMGQRTMIDYSATPWVVFTNPNLASVGMGESEVMSKYGACTCRVIDLKTVAKAQLLGAKGLAKLILNPKDGRILGAQVLAPFASEFITEVAIAIKAKMSYDDLINTIHVFPTMSEVLKVTAQAFLRDVSLMSCCVE
ncbi:Mercuric reductase [archaeon HR06]|nr:Mercuric reductase [archaeon HR06]